METKNNYKKLKQSVANFKNISFFYYCGTFQIMDLFLTLQNIRIQGVVLLRVARQIFIKLKAIY